MHTLIDPSDKSQIPRTTFQTFPQVRILGLVCVYNLTVGQDNLEIDDLIATEASDVGVERVLSISVPSLL
jgi:hypothetical protein